MKDINERDLEGERGVRIVPELDKSEAGLGENMEGTRYRIDENGGHVTEAPGKGKGLSRWKSEVEKCLWLKRGCVQDGENLDDDWKELEWNSSVRDRQSNVSEFLFGVHCSEFELLVVTLFWSAVSLLSLHHSLE